MSGILLAMAGMSGSPGAVNGAPNSSSSIGAAGWELQNDGDYVVSSGAGTATADWVTPSETTIAAFYEVKVDATSGSFDSGTTGTYLSLNTTRSWSKNSGTVEFTYTIREIATGIVRKTEAGRTLSAP